ncbi:unnamed protein product [Peniophora sp. CBMAI 1063]|nr:unnamed protein product [Peniophora sp. CBMAI 1063]
MGSRDLRAKRRSQAPSETQYSRMLECQHAPFAFSQTDSVPHRAHADYPPAYHFTNAITLSPGPVRSQSETCTCKAAPMGRPSTTRSKPPSTTMIYGLSGIPSP